MTHLFPKDTDKEGKTTDSRLDLLASRLLGTGDGFQDEFGALLPSNEFIVVEQAFVSRQTVGAVGESQQTQAEDFPVLELPFEFHPVAPGEHAQAMVTTLKEFSIVSVERKKNHARSIDRRLPVRTHFDRSG